MKIIENRKIIILNFVMLPFPHPCFDFLNFFFFKFVLSIPFRKSIIGVDYGKKSVFSKFEKISIVLFAYFFWPILIFSIIAAK